MRCARRPAARQHLRQDAEIVGGEVSRRFTSTLGKQSFACVLVVNRGRDWKVSIDLQLERSDNRGPTSNIVRERASEFFRGWIDGGFETCFDQFLLVGPFCKRRARGLRNLLDDRYRCSGRCEQSN